MLAVSFLSVLAVLSSAQATQVMHRPEDFKATGPPAHQARTFIGERGTTRTSVGYFTNWGIYGRNFRESFFLH